MTEIFPGSLPYPGKTLHHVVMCCAICFIWTFLGLTEKPHSYYVGNIKGCVATRAEVESVGGLWHTPRFFSTRPPKTCMQCECSRRARPCGDERGSRAASNEAVLQWTSTWFQWKHHWMPSAEHLPGEILDKSIWNGQYVHVVLHKEFYIMIFNIWTLLNQAAAS